MTSIRIAIVDDHPTIIFAAAELQQVPALKGVLRKPLHWKDIAEFIVRHWPDQTGPVLHQPAMAS